jgi:hypothetical protein
MYFTSDSLLGNKVKAMKKTYLFLVGIGLVSGSIPLLSAKTQLNQGIREDGLDPSFLTEMGRGAWIAPDEAFEPPTIAGDDNLPPLSSNTTVIITSDDGFGDTRFPNSPGLPWGPPGGRYIWTGRQNGGGILSAARFKFPLFSIPNSAAIVEVKFLAYQITSAGGDARVDRTQVSPSNDTWSAATLTWNYMLANPAEPPVISKFLSTGLGWKTLTNAALTSEVQSQNNPGDDVLSLELDSPTGSFTYWRDFENREYFMSNEAELHVEIQVDWDISVESIDDPVINDGGFGLKEPNVPFAPEIRVRNRGGNDINDAEVRVDITGPSPRYSETMTTGFLANTTGEIQLTFPDFTPGDEPSKYVMTIRSRITDPSGHNPDDNPTNNFKNGDFYSWSDKDDIPCVFTTSPPTIDGNVDRDRGEWTGAVSLDISDVHGKGWEVGLTDSGPNPPGSALLHAMNDERFLYIGIETVDPTNTYFDQDGLYFDDNHTHNWFPFGKEGNFWQINDYQEEIAFRSLPSYSTTYNPSMVFSSVDLQPTGLEYEIAIPMGAKFDPPWYLDPAEVSNNVMGTYIWTWDYANEAYGYFPSTMNGFFWNMPLDYGHICVDLPNLVSDLDVSKASDNPESLHLQFPGIVGGKGEVEIRYQVPSFNHVRLNIYDIMGRQVATLVDGKVEAGVHTASFNTGDLSSGVYFYRLTDGSSSQTGKLVVLK